MRQSWKFQYRGDQVLAAAVKKLGYHQDRLKSWQEESLKADKDLRATGLEFREMAITGGARVDAVLDPQKQSRLNECRSKVTEHKTASEGYERWARVLTANQDQLLELDIDDATYFGL